MYLRQLIQLIALPCCREDKHMSSIWLSLLLFSPR